ncbi:MAG: SIMPL domain-containing protein [Thermodesulfobacteriota bacterium]
MSKNLYLGLSYLAATFLINSLAFSQTVNNEKNTLQVNGKGVVTAKPDKANVTISVETTNQNASTAVKENAEKMNQVMEKLKSQIGKNDKISTTGYNLSPIYTYDEKTRKSELSGYRVSNSIVVESKNLDVVGKLIDSATQAGANRIESLSFDTDKRDEYRREALVKAVQDARETAEIVAKAAGVTIAKIIQISPSYEIPIPVYREFALTAREAAAPPPTQIEPGELTVSASVNMVFEIQ